MRISDWSSDVCSSDLLAVHFDATVLVQLDGVRFEPRRRARPKTECDNDAIRRNDLFRARHDLRLATTARVGRAKRGGDDLHALDLVGTDDLDRRAVEQEFDTFLLGVDRTSTPMYTRNSIAP